MKTSRHWLSSSSSSSLYTIPSFQSLFIPQWKLIWRLCLRRSPR